MARALSLATLRAEGEAFHTEISREFYESMSGLKPEARLQAVYDAHAAIFGEEAFELAREAFMGSTEGSVEQRSASILLDWQLDSKAGRELAPLDERIMSWESNAVVRLDDGREIPYERLAIDLANSGDRAERAMIEKARVSLVTREFAPMKQERLQRERDITEGAGIARDYNAAWELLSGISLSGLRAECEAFLRDTQSMWDEMAPWMTQRTLGMRPGEMTRGDIGALLRAREFDAFFPANDMEASVRRQVREMGMDPEAGGRIIYDTGEREGKRSRAFCAPVRVPDEVYLVLRPHGGQTDWNTLLHELGHALHFAHMRGDLPMEFRFTGDNSVTEGFAMLFDHLMQDAGWLQRYTALERNDTSPFLRRAGFEELYFLRRYCAKIIYESQLYARGDSWRTLPDLYATTLTSALTFQYSPADAFIDIDPRYYSARYLRAWQYQAILTETLVERYDSDWWRNPKAGPWLVNDLFSEGQRELAHEQAARVTGKTLGFAPLLRSLERMLG